MKVAFVSSDWQRTRAGRLEPGGVNWWRMMLPAYELARNGYEIVHGHAVGGDEQMLVRDREGRWHGDCEIVVLQRLTIDGVLEKVQQAVAAGQVVLNDMDDYFWALPRTSVNHRLVTPKDRETYKQVLRASSGIICSTPFLARALARFGPPTFVCRNMIDTERWRFRGEGRYVGWVGAVDWRANDLALLRDSVVPYLREAGEPFYHGGHLPAGRSAGAQIGYDHAATRPLCGMRDYPALWEPLRVAVIPLEDCTFNRAKSWCKPLEACARGVPFIASRLPEYEALSVGRLARKPREWRAHLEALRDPDLRAAEGAANRRRAEELSTANQWHQWDTVLRETRRVA